MGVPHNMFDTCEGLRTARNNFNTKSESINNFNQYVNVCVNTVEGLKQQQ
jgi:hypothetical protein